MNRKKMKEKSYITVLRGLNRLIRFNLKWDFKNPNWRLNKEVKK